MGSIYMGDMFFSWLDCIAKQCQEKDGENIFI